MPWFSLQTLGQCLGPTLAMRPSQIGEGLLGLKGALVGGHGGDGEQRHHHAGSQQDAENALFHVFHSSKLFKYRRTSDNGSFGRAISRDAAGGETDS